MGKKILLVTGGTGGHVFPAKALAEELRDNGWDVNFAIDKRACRFFEPRTDAIFVINSSSILGGILAKCRALFLILVGMIQAIILLMRLKPDIVVGFGGYPTFPTMFVASRFGYNTVIHEQNSILGLANRALVSACAHMAVSYQFTEGIPASSIDKVVYTGNPVRKDIAAIASTPYSAFADKKIFRILVIGGSQGATLFNNVLPGAIELIPKKLRSKIKVIQQVRKENQDAVRDLYKKYNVEAEIVEFFDDVADKYAMADLVVSRGGATTLAELVATGRPAIIIPIASSVHNHQFLNANFLTKNKAAYMLEESNFNAKTLSEAIENFMNTPATLEDMSKNMMQTRRDGAHELVRLINSVARL